MERRKGKNCGSLLVPMRGDIVLKIKPPQRRKGRNVETEGKTGSS